MQAQTTDRPTHCAECHSALPEQPRTSGAAGYATRQDGSHICYPCADAAARLARDVSGRCDCYLASDGKMLTTWTGGNLLRVTSEREVIGRGFGGARTERTYLRATAPDGSQWHGVGGGRGMYARMRRSKGKR